MSFVPYAVIQLFDLVAPERPFGFDEKGPKRAEGSPPEVPGRYHKRTISNAIFPHFSLLSVGTFQHNAGYSPYRNST